MNTRTKRILTAGIGTGAALAGLLFAGAGPAQAASADQAAAICGAGYWPDGEATLPDTTSLPTSSIIYISYNGTTDCAVNIKVQEVGTPTPMYVYLNGPNPSWGGDADNGSWDGGNYSYYAGPVYTNAPGACIEWGGGYGASLEIDLGPDHCG